MQQLDNRLECLLDRFENEVKPYDKMSVVGLIVTPIAIVSTIIFGWLLAPPLPHDEVLRSIIYSERIYWVIGAIIAIVASANLPILYADHKKHEISRIKYKPLTGGRCMCDLSQLRYHMRRLEKSNYEGERIKHARMVTLYKEKLSLN
jgi:hypothetical protein